MSTVGFTLGFSDDDSWCTVIDDETRRALLIVKIRGAVDPKRRDKIARLVGDVIAECLGGVVFIGSFEESEPS